MKTFELIILTKATTSPKIINTIKNTLDFMNAIDLEINTEGVKRLAYPIEGQDFAAYYTFKFSWEINASPKNQALLRTINGNKSILRTLLQEVPF